MLENTSRDGRLDFEVAVTQLIQANFGPKDSNGAPVRDTNGNIVMLTTEQVKQYRNRINMEEITQGYLLMFAVLSPAKSLIQFAVVDTQQVSNSPVTPLSRLLTMQDSFLISNMSYYLTQYAYTAGPASFQDPNFSSQNHWTPITYTATYHNNGTGIAYDPGCDMFWIGAYLQLVVQKRQLIPYLDCSRFYHCPVTQPTPSYPSPSNYIPHQQSSYDGSADGFVYVQPNIVIGGGRTNVLTLNLSANIPAIAPFNNVFYNAAPDGFVTMATVAMRGILMQNSTTVK